MQDFFAIDHAARARDWLIDTALPFWGTTGFDAKTGGFHERCSLDGTPIDDTSRRLMVQARQIFVFSHAHVLGWSPHALELAARGVEHILQRYHRADGRPGFVFSLTPSGDVADGRRNTYGHAFVLLALAWYARAAGDAQALAAARAVVDFIEAEFGDGHDAFVDDVPRSDMLKRQNPHMHLLEGFLALYETTRDPAVLKRADRIVELCRSRFCNDTTGVLHEYFADDWRSAPNEQGRIWEPGHHYEWSWLLHAHARLTGTRPAPEARALFERARANGFSADGRIYDEVRDDNLVLKSSTRAWPLTEAVKAGVVRSEHGDPDGRKLAESALATLMDRFMARPWRAGWIDHLDAAGNPMVDYAPASTLYHVYLAIAEANRTPQRAAD